MLARLACDSNCLGLNEWNPRAFNRPNTRLFCPPALHRFIPNNVQRAPANASLWHFL